MQDIYLYITQCVKLKYDYFIILKNAISIDTFFLPSIFKER